MSIDLNQFYVDPYQFGLDLIRGCSQSLAPRARLDQESDPEERDAQPGYQKKWEPEK